MPTGAFSQRGWRKCTSGRWQTWLLALAWLWASTAAHAEARGAPAAHQAAWQSVQWQLDAQDYLSVTAAASLVLPEAVVDALQQGVPMYFLARAQLARKRLWWLQRVEVVAQRHWRLSFQPLTGAWRLQQSDAPFAADQAGSGLAQHFSSLEAALGAMGQLGHWAVVPVERLVPGKRHLASLVFELDRSLLPRPLQFDFGERAEWEFKLVDDQHLQWSGQVLQTDRPRVR